MMGGNTKELSHEEVWDDSALIDSWNEALAEYKKYHSIHAKGGSVRDVEPRVKTSERPDKAGPQPAEAMDDGEMADAEDVNQEDSKAAHDGPPNKGSTAGLGAFPVQAVLGSVQDENLKKLLMSWYYAGYYTGLFEGQQQAQQGH
ncbi:hypothetical protein BGZ63DRAFT_475048 [Mariannaea sp. PMI_226]|nr:hypothetical protein BGZ63DRAFT_475048 [Mariannaea sp. PMI_226]